MLRTRKKGVLSIFLRDLRHKVVFPYLLKGTVFDFGSKDEVFKNKLPKGMYFGAKDTKPGDRYKIEGVYDTFLLIAVVEHVLDIDSLFKEILPHIKKRIIITTPSRIGKYVLETGSDFGLFHSHNKEEHVKYYSKKELVKLLEKYGFTIVRYRSFELGLNHLIIGDK